MSTPYSELVPITKDELRDLKKIAESTGTSSQYKNAKGEIFSITDIITGKVKGEDAKAVGTGGSSEKVSDPNYGLENVRGTDK